MQVFFWQRSNNSHLVTRTRLAEMKRKKANAGKFFFPINVAVPLQLIVEWTLVTGERWPAELYCIGLASSNVLLSLLPLVINTEHAGEDKVLSFYEIFF